MIELILTQYNGYVCFFCHIEPKYCLTLQKRVILEKLERFVRLCGYLILRLLQRLVIKSLSTLELRIHLALSHATTNYVDQDAKFQMMKEQILSQPYVHDIPDMSTVRDGEDAKYSLLLPQANSLFESSVDILGKSNYIN